MNDRKETIEDIVGDIEEMVADVTPAQLARVILMTVDKFDDDEKRGAAVAFILMTLAKVTTEMTVGFLDRDGRLVRVEDDD